MARSSTTFKKGNTASKGKGRKPLDPDVKAAKKLSQNEFIRLANRWLYATEDEVKVALKDPKLPMLERMVLGIIEKGISQGDQFRLTMLLDRTIGKVKEPDRNINLLLGKMSDEQVIAAGKEAIKYLEGGDAE